MFDNFILQNTKTGNQVEFNFEDGETPTPTPTGDVSNSTATFTEASTRTNILSGETLSVIFGKIKKFFADLKTVAFTGSYDDLSNKPTIPTVNNATLTIKQGETTKGTFSANADTDVTITLDEGGGGGTTINTFNMNLTIPSGSTVLNKSANAINYLTDLSDPCLVAQGYDNFWNNTYRLFFNGLASRTLSADIGGVNVDNIDLKSIYESSQSISQYQFMGIFSTVSGGHYWQIGIAYVSDKFNYYLLDPFAESVTTTDEDLAFNIECLDYVTFSDNRN